LSAVEKSAFNGIILSLHGHIHNYSAQACSSYSIIYCKQFVQSFHGGYSSGCIESAKQPSPTEKSTRTTLHYIIQMMAHVSLSYSPRFEEIMLKW